MRRLRHGTRKKVTRLPMPLTYAGYDSWVELDGGRTVAAGDEVEGDGSDGPGQNGEGVEHQEAEALLEEEKGGQEVVHTVLSTRWCSRRTSRRGRRRRIRGEPGLRQGATEREEERCE